MSRIKLDLNMFKHVKSDKDSTTLQHKDGHQLTLAHGKLTKESRAQLEALSKMAKEAKQPDDKGVERHEQQVEPKKVAAKPKFAEGGDVSSAEDMLKFDPMAVPQEAQAPQIDPALARQRELYNKMVSGQAESPDQVGSESQKAMMFGADGREPAQFDPTAWQRATQAYSQETASNAAQAAAAQQEAAKINEARTAAGLQPIPMPSIPNGPQIPGSPTNLPQPQADMLPNPLQPSPNAQAGNGLAGAVDNVEGMMQQGFQQQMQGINEQAKAQAQLGQEQSAILQERQNSIQDAQIAYKREYDALEAERQAHMQDIRDAHIDPNKYWTGDKNGNGSHSKIASAIGMIIAGFNPTNQPNAAINLLKQQMEMNLQAQKENLGSEQNLLSANLRQFGNLKDASDMTRLMQSDMVQAQLQDAAAKAQTPMARAAALSAAGQLQMQTAPLFQQFAMRRAMLGLTDGSNGGDPSNTAAAEQMIQYARMTNPEMAKEMEGRLVPGVGMAKIHVPEGVRKELVEKTNLDRAAQDLLAYSKKHTNLIPGTPEYNYGATKALALQQKVREGMLGGVFKEGEKPLLEKFVNENPAGALKAFSTQPQLKAIIESNRVGLDSIKRSVGLPITPYASIGGESNGPVKGKDGKMYIRQGNYMVPYKAPKGK